MSENFLQFKQRLGAFRGIKAALIGLSAGSIGAGIWLTLTKLSILGFEPVYSILVGLGLVLIVGGLVFILGGKSDLSFAEELDARFDLKARVQTMVSYRDEVGDMFDLQRADTDKKLSEIPLKSYKFKGLWIYILVFVLSLGVLTGGFLTPDMRNVTPPEEIVPFELTELQEMGIEELIKYVENSEMEDEFRTPIADELRILLEKLRLIDTQNDMRAALVESMAMIMDITYRSSTATEMLNALWESEDTYFRYLAKTLDTSSWTAPDWGDFAEKTVDYIAVLLGENDESQNAVVGAKRLKISIDSMVRRLDITLDSSGIFENDEIYAAIKALFEDEDNGLKSILDKIDSLSDAEAKAAVEFAFNSHIESLYAAISLNKINASTGEYTMTRLGSLFLVPVPEFERPDFVKNNESVCGGQNSGANDDKDNGNHNGGVGEGATFGSDDLILDPLTGEYVEYGKLINKYYGIMLERLDGNSYTEDQKTAIKKYFELLYSGLEEKEGK